MTNNPHFAGLDAFAVAHPIAAITLAGKKDFSGEGFGATLLQRLSGIIDDGTTGDDLADLLEAFRDVLETQLKGEFIVRLAKDARAHTESRLREGKPRALLGTTPIINLTTIAQALRRTGVEATALCFNTYHITKEFDINLSVQNQWVNENRPDLWGEFRLAVFVWAYINFDVFFYYNDCGIMRPGGYGHPNFGINVEEMQCLVAAGKRLYTLTYGADNRVRQKTLDSGKYNFCMHCPEPGRHCICDDEAGARVLDTIDQYATAMLASGLSVDYIPNSYELHYLVIDTDSVAAEPVDEDEGPLRILHAPNHPFFKGSVYLEDAVKALRKEGVAIELELISGKSNAEVLEAMRRSHVVADQFIGGAYGQTAIEAMARGRPTLCYIRHPERVADPESLPVINVNPETLVAALRDLAAMPRSELADIGRRSRRYIEEHHSIGALSARLCQLLSATADWPATVHLSAPAGYTPALPDPGNRNARETYLAARRDVRRHLEALLSEMFENMEGGPVPSSGGEEYKPVTVLDGVMDVYRGLGRIDRYQRDLTDEIRQHVTAIMNFVDSRVGDVARSAEMSLSRLDEFGGQLDVNRGGALGQALLGGVIDAVHAASTATRPELVEVVKALLSAAAQERDTAGEALQGVVVDAVHAASAAARPALVSAVEAMFAAAEEERRAARETLRGSVVDAVYGAGAVIKGDIVNAVDTAGGVAQARVAASVSELLAEAERARSTEAEALRSNVVDAVHAASQAVHASQAAALERQLAALEREAAILRDELAAARRGAEAAHANLLALESARAAVTAERDQWQAQAGQADAERRALAELFERQAASLRAERDEAAERARASAARIAAVESSVSWRLTAPVRWLSGRLPVLGRLIRGVWRGARAIVRKAMSLIARPFRRVLDPLLAWLWPVRRRHPHSPARKTLYPVNAVTTEEWLAEFERLNGRKLKVLHIGNIANNAYNNAKIQRQRNIDADVLCNDYYHIMACPEWEDGVFTRTVANEYFPDWWRAGLKGFRRPRWFVQGPLDACIRYLVAHTAEARSSKFLWRWLTFERWMLCHPSLLARVIRRLTLNATNRVIQYDAGPANGIVWSYFGAKMVEWAEPNAGKWPRLAPKVRASGRRLARFGRTADPMKAMVRHLYRTQNRREAARERLSVLLGGRENIPSVDWHFNWWYHPYMPLLFGRYDVVQAYATYTAMPFIIGADYVAYEHGTIRSIPFQDTDEGKLCMATYRAAGSVFVTNTDNLESANRMGLDPDRVSALPHAFDSDKLVRFQRRTRINPPKGTTVFFTPARQHWVDGDPGWAKGNDRIIRALRMLKDQGLSCRLDAIEWGVDVGASRALAAELQVEDMVNWLPKLKKRDLWRRYLTSHAVLDQFVAPAFGGVTFEALMLGRRVITAVDEAEMTRFFGEAPPLYNCRTAEEIAEAMARVIADPGDDAGDGQRNQDWMQARHSADAIVRIQVERYRRHGGEARAVAGVAESVTEASGPA